jgi:hypothetical protein
LLFGLAARASAADIADITRLQDVTFANLDPMVSASSSQTLCVYSSALTTLYTVTATGSGVGQAFTLSAGGSIPALPYSVLWSPTAGQTTGTTLTAGTPLPNQSAGSLVTALLCALGTGSSASLTINLATNDLQQALSGVTYTGLLSITITAQ